MQDHLVGDNERSEGSIGNVNICCYKWVNYKLKRNSLFPYRKITRLKKSHYRYKKRSTEGTHHGLHPIKRLESMGANSDVPSWHWGLDPSDKEEKFTSITII